jgi:hypothetical protein
MIAVRQRFFHSNFNTLCKNDKPRKDSGECQE